jgi:signal transduction histidine kinase
MAAVAEKTLDELTLTHEFDLEELVDRQALGEMVESFYDLFRVPLRVFGEQGKLLADTSAALELYRYLATLPRARAAVESVVSDVKSLQPPEDGQLTHSCVTGALYRVVAIRYEGRALGRLILGPFVPPSVSELPAALIELEPDLDLDKARALFERMPRADEATAARLANHLRRTLDLILFSGHKALLTSSMHLASIRESYRDLSDKTGRLQQAYDRLKELDRLKSNFLATVSHELRTPLTSIIGYSEMLVEGIAGELGVEQRDFVRTIRDKGEQLLELIKGLLDLSKLESGTFSMKKAMLEIEPLVSDIVQTLQPVARKKMVDIEQHVELGLPELWGDRDRLRQVLLNLTENAVKFSESGGSVIVSGRLGTMDPDVADSDGIAILGARRPAIELRISDEGIGIPESERGRVFDPFYQVDSSSTREHGGTGLGLSIVKRLVDGHGGRISIEDNQPQGTVFVVRLPIKRATLS